MTIAREFARPTLRVGILGAALLIGAGASAPAQAEGNSNRDWRTEIRQEFETRGPKAPGVWVTRQVQVGSSAAESFKQASVDRRSRLARN